MARRRESATLSPLELEIVQILGKVQSATVRQVLDQMPDQQPAYATVENILIVLHRKGKIVRINRDGAYHYGAIPNHTSITG